jgi:methionine aminotransferase
MAYADIMEFPELYLELPAFYQERRDYFLDRIRGSRFRPLDCAGTYFAMLDYSAISDEPDLQFAERMIRDYGVAAIPPSVFYNNGDDHRVLRFCFAKKQETLDNAAEKLCRI